MVLGAKKRTGLHKEVFVVPKYFNNILGTYSHIERTFIPGKFESNRTRVL